MKRAQLFGGLLLTAVASVAADDAAQPTTKLLPLAPGMQWEYVVTGSMRPPNAPAAVPMKGRITIKIVERDLKGQAHLALEFAQQIAPDAPPPGAPPPGAPPPASAGAPPTSIFGDAPAVGLFFFRQDAASADVYFVGDNHGPAGAVRAARGEGGLFIPGVWSNTTSYNNKIEWEDGGVTHNFLAVDGVEVVKTGIGPLPAWRAPNGSQSSDGIEIKGVDWWTPELGQPAQFEAITKLPNGMQINIRAVLERTNVLSK